MESSRPWWGEWLADLQTRWTKAPEELVRRYPLLMLVVGMLVGGLVGRQTPELIPSPLWSCALAIAVGGVGWRLLRGLGQNFWVGLLGILAVMLAAGLLGASLGKESIGPEEDELSRLSSRKSQPIVVRAMLQSAPVWAPNPHFRPNDTQSSPWQTRWDVRCLEVFVGQEWKRIDACSSLVVAGRVVNFLPGDVLEIYGSVRKITEPTNPGAFDFAAHQRNYRRRVMLSADGEQQLRLLRSSWLQPLQRLRGWAVREVDQLLHRWVTHGQAPLAAALVFGQRQQVDWQEQQELMATGTLHMLAISGMHVDIVATAFMLLCLLLRASQRQRLITLALVCFIYAGLADGKPPVLRAAILVLAIEIASYQGKRARLANVLGLAAMVLFLLHAANLENVGVHLSFLAVAAIGIFVLDRDSLHKRPLAKLLQDSQGAVPRLVHLLVTWLWGMLRLSFWVWLITCPLVWYHFNVVSPIAVPLNVLVALPLAFSLLMGLLTGLLGWITPIGYVAGNLCGAFLGGISWLVDLGKAVPYGHFWGPAPSTAWIVGFYGVILVWFALFGKKYRTTLGLLLSVLLAAALWSSHNSSGGPQPGEKGIPTLAVTFLDVGHGTSVVVQMPDGRVWVYDAGHLGAADRSHQEIAAALWHCGISGIDTLVLSHADADHYNAVPGLVERFQVGRVVSTSRFWNSPDPLVQDLINTLHQHSITCEVWQAGDAGNVGLPGAVADSGSANEGSKQPGVEWQVLHPRPEQIIESDNAGSLCLLLTFGGQRILLPGDLDGSGMLSLIELPDRPCQVLMAPHHGSLTRDPIPLLEWCRPELIVISGNHRAARKEVLRKYQPMAGKLAVTFRDGAIRLTVQLKPNGTSQSVQHWTQQGWSDLSRQDSHGQ